MDHWDRREPLAHPTPAPAPGRQISPALPLGGCPFPPIADYGFLSDCETIALVAPGGGIEWMCLPRVDGPSVFGAMLDRDAGAFRLGPAGINVPASRRYLPGTMVLETSWWTGAGWVIVRDALLIGAWHHEDERSHTHRRAPTDYDADHVLLRTVRCVNGEVEILLDCEPSFDYGRQRAHWEYSGPGYHDGVARCEGSDTWVGLRTDLRLGFEGSRATARHRMKEGEQIFCALSWSEQRHHLAGSLGAALADRMFELGWVSRARRGRAVQVSDAGYEGLRETFGVELAPS